MSELIAQGPEPDDRWRRNLEIGDSFSIGRQAGRCSTPWDSHISRRHVEVTCHEGELEVEVLPNATNPAFYRGQPAQKFRLKPGEHFVIGKTTFSLIDPQGGGPIDLPGPTGERTFVTRELHQRPFREPDKRIQALSRLPDVIHRSASDQELFQRLVNLLLAGIERATAAAVVSLDGKASESTSSAPVSVLHWDRHLLAANNFRPSHRLVRQAITSSQSVAYVWGRDKGDSQTDFTSSGQTQWAICTPVADDVRSGWALYVAGNFDDGFGKSGPADPEHLHDDVKYTEIMGATLGGLLQSRRLAARQASLGQFFTPVVLAAIRNDDPEKALAPREADLTVLFCDLRGFTSESERLAHDLFGLLHRVSDALGVMTRQILQEGGVIGDFHGDAAMGFWGWPIAQADSAARACAAALGIRANFDTEGSCDSPHAADANSLGRFRVGIGLASGRAVAGKIGTADQVKVTAFGPVVNLASRLETMTRQIPAAILADEPTAMAIKSVVSTGVCRVRRVAKVQPVGLAAPLDVYEVLPSEHDCPDITDAGLAQYDSALAAFEAGDWARAIQLLGDVPTADRSKEFLVEFIGTQGNFCPTNWQGAIRLSAK